MFVNEEKISHQDALIHQAHLRINELKYQLWRDQVDLTDDQKKALYTNIWELYQ